VSALDLRGNGGRWEVGKGIVKAVLREKLSLAPIALTCEIWAAQGFVTHYMGKFK